MFKRLMLFVVKKNYSFDLYHLTKIYRSLIICKKKNHDHLLRILNKLSKMM